MLGVALNLFIFSWRLSLLQATGGAREPVRDRAPIGSSGNSAVVGSKVSAPELRTFLYVVSGLLSDDGYPGFGTSLDFFLKSSPFFSSRLKLKEFTIWLK
ncbi:unnamed protein product [Rangifer tarandus platyrhynchus]|uniref:Secreted protein n=2 Tax=Rangifer tarandus platyrhynchus TaxID=3082113 RepID=A0ABN8ZS45_RANTA|nr:unnamed protein product [Rangifer tarandus platyrhynchus]